MSLIISSRPACQTFIGVSKNEEYRVLFSEIQKDWWKAPRMLVINPYKIYYERVSFHKHFSREQQAKYLQDVTIIVNRANEKRSQLRHILLSYPYLSHSIKVFALWDNCVEHICSPSTSLETMSTTQLSFCILTLGIYPYGLHFLGYIMLPFLALSLLITIFFAKLLDIINCRHRSEWRTGEVEWLKNQFEMHPELDGLVIDDAIYQDLGKLAAEMKKVHASVNLWIGIEKCVDRYGNDVEEDRQLILFHEVAEKNEEELNLEEGTKSNHLPLFVGSQDTQDAAAEYAVLAVRFPHTVMTP